MDYLYLLLATGSAVHAYSFGYYLKKSGKKVEFIVIALGAVFTVLLPIYRLYYHS